MFKRGSGPLVSVLLPTRSRSKWLCEAIDSVYSLAKDKSNVEFLLKIDEDDNDTIATAEWLSKVLPVKKLISPRGKGYFDIHHWINSLSSMASGDWLFLFNDDARMQTQDWDQILLNAEVNSNTWHGIDDICLLVAPTTRRPGCNEFMFIRRKIFEILGRLGTSQHVDNWMYSMMSFIQSAFHTNIFIEHFSEKAEDEVRKSSEEAYKTTIQTLNSNSGVKIRIQDALRLVEYIEIEMLKKGNK